MAELPRGWITVAAAAARAGVSEAAIRKRIRAGTLEAGQMLGQYLVNQQSLDRWKPRRAGRKRGAPE